MAAGEWYRCQDDELANMRMAASRAVFTHNSTPPDQRENISPALRALMGSVAPDARIEVPFHCAYGCHIHLGAAVFLNAGCVLLDSAEIRIGAGTMLGPHVQIYCPQHHTDPALRKAGLEIARPVHIGENVWVGGGAIILGGVTVGDHAIIGAGAVVTRDVPANATVVGNPARPIHRDMPGA
ncbi:maltose acetyltransferase [Thalassospira profundimaris]|uniref:Nodulation protein L n=1 Tax=Thalassospira profundimaris TaxID=502049 RepID=A0A367X4Y2_9PROT|nr:sugar O-acetyltransferase [Thalassospira profundimaris]RCK48647.1 maltose acetyltransferase [Thalassospira profundimaris]